MRGLERLVEFSKIEKDEGEYTSCPKWFPATQQNGLVTSRPTLFLASRLSLYDFFDIDFTTYDKERKKENCA